VLQDAAAVAAVRLLAEDAGLAGEQLGDDGA
jgi:hypothetical protein